MRVGRVLSRSQLDPFLYIWYHTIRTQNGLSLCGRRRHFRTQSWPSTVDKKIMYSLVISQYLLLLINNDILAYVCVYFVIN